MVFASRDCPAGVPRDDPEAKDYQEALGNKPPASAAFCAIFSLARKSLIFPRTEEARGSDPLTSTRRRRSAWAADRWDHRGVGRCPESRGGRVREHRRQGEGSYLSGRCRSSLAPVKGYRRITLGWVAPGREAEPRRRGGQARPSGDFGG